jgi:HD-like signal output (HDOD) protein
MNRLGIDAVVNRLRDLPSLPAVVMELLTSIDQEEVDIRYWPGSCRTTRR